MGPTFLYKSFKKQITPRPFHSIFTTGGKLLKYALSGRIKTSNSVLAVSKNTNSFLRKDSFINTHTLQDKRITKLIVWQDASWLVNLNSRINSVRFKISWRSYTDNSEPNVFVKKKFRYFVLKLVVLIISSCWRNFSRNSHTHHNNM